MKCFEGDMAIIIDAYNPENIGKIVKVLRKQTMRERLRIRHQGTVWIVHSAEKLKWNMWGRHFMENFGPVPENQLQPLKSSTHYERLNENPTQRMNCGTFMIMEYEERCEMRRLEMSDPSKCEF